MLISHRKRFVYTKTIKTAGTSVESYFERYCMPEGSWEFSHAREMYVGDSGVIGYRGMSPAEGREWSNHMPAEPIKLKTGVAIWNKYFKFCVVRNPFEKLISAFYFFEAPGMYESAPPTPTVINNVGVIDRFRLWMAAGNATRYIDRDKYIIDGSICVDYFIRYESIDVGIKYVCDRLKVPFDISRLPRLKVSSRDRKIKISDYYDRNAIDIVENNFEFELANFGYDLS